MNAPQDHDAQLLQLGGASAAVIRNKDRLLAEFCERVQSSLPSAKREPHPVIIDTLPAFITRISLALAPNQDLEFASQYSNIALQHGNERARFTRYSLNEVIREYQFIREILSRMLRADASLTDQEWDIAHRSLDEAVAEAAASFVRVHESFRDLFTAALTHDFRGPLANAWNYLELTRRTDEAAQRNQYAARAANNLRGIDRMIAELLDVSRSNAGERLTLELADGEASRLVREVLDGLVARAGDRLVLHADLPAPVHWDLGKMRRAVQNLVDNAIKYGQSDTAITLQVTGTHGRVLLSVHNFGDPIPPSEQAVLFQPYRRAPAAETGGKAGWGLGLALVEVIAEAHGGSVSLESSIESGTTFTVDVLADVRNLEPQPEKPA